MKSIIVFLIAVSLTLVMMADLVESTVQYSNSPTTMVINLETLTEAKRTEYIRKLNKLDLNPLSPVNQHKDTSNESK